MGSVAGYRYRLTGGTPVDVGNVVSRLVTGLPTGVSQGVELQAYDDSGNYSGWSSIVYGTPKALLDDLAMPAGAFAFGVDLLRSAYSGPAFRLASVASGGATQIDVNFLSDGTYDWATHLAFGTGDEQVVKQYDQSGNAQHRTIPYANAIKLRVSTYNGKPELYGLSGHGSIAAFTGWNGVADYNLIIAERQIGTNQGTIYSGGSDLHYGYSSPGTPTIHFGDNASSARNIFATSYSTNAGHIWRMQFDGGGASDALRNRVFLDGDELARTSGATIPATSTNETGIFFNSKADGTDNRNPANFATIFLPYQLTGPEWATIDAGLRAVYYPFSGQINGYGTSLIVGYNLNAIDPTHVPLEQVAALLETSTGFPWAVVNDAEVAAQTDRILQLVQDSTKFQVDKFKYNLAIGDGGTNDLATTSGGGVSAATTLTRITNLANELKTQGHDLILFADIPRRTDVGIAADFESKRVTAQAGLDAALGSGITRVYRADDASQLDPDDTTWFIDKVHRTLLGYTRDAQMYYEAAAPVLGIDLNPTITNSTLAAATVGAAYSDTVDVNSGNAPLTFTVYPGTLPGGLSLNSSTGAITGTPTTPGTFNFTIRVTDTDGDYDDQAYSVVASAPAAIDPETISSFKAVLYAEDLSQSDNSDINLWNDRTTSNNDMIGPPSGGNSPKFRSTGGPGGSAALDKCVQFDSTGAQWFDWANFSTFPEAEMFVIVKLDADPPPTNNNAFFDLGPVNADFFPYDATDFYCDFFSTVRHHADSTSDWDVRPNLASQYRIINFKSKAGLWEVRVDDIVMYTTATNTVSAPATSKFGENGGGLLDGRVVFVGLSNAVLSSGDHDGVQLFLETHYGL